MFKELYDKKEKRNSDDTIKNACETAYSRETSKLTSTTPKVVEDEVKKFCCLTSDPNP